MKTVKKEQENMFIDEGNDFFRQATLSIFSSLDIEISMKRFMDFLKKHVPATGMILGIYDPDRNISKILTSIWPPDLRKPDKTLFMPGEFWKWMKEN